MVGWNHAASVVAGDGRGKVPLEYTGMIDAFRKTVRHEGFGALYKGLVPNSVKVSHHLTVMIYFAKFVSTFSCLKMKTCISFLLFRKILLFFIYHWKNLRGTSFHMDDSCVGFPQSYAADITSGCKPNNKPT